MHLGDGAVEQSDKSGDSDEGTLRFFSCFLLGRAFSWISLMCGPTTSTGEGKGTHGQGQESNATYLGKNLT